MTAQRKTRAGTAPRLTQIMVRGFKSLRDQTTVEVRPLTILAGANSAGKSSIMQPLLLLKQTLEAPFDPGPLRLDGPNVRFTQSDQVFWLKGEKARRFSVRLECSVPPSVEITFGSSPGESIGIVSQETSGGGFDLQLRPDSEPTDLKTQIPESLFQALTESVENGGRPRILRAVREKCFLQLADAREHDRAKRSGGERFPVLPAFDPVPPWVSGALLGLLHLPGVRGNPERRYPCASVGAEFAGVFQDYTASTILSWQQGHREKRDQLNHALELLGMTWKVEAKPVDETRVELRVGRLPHGRRGGAYDLVNIADVGFGVSQCLPVVVALVAARTHQILYVEQPEIHLHPRAQVAMAGLLADAAKRGVRLIVETHSSLLLRSIQALVAKDELSPDLVKLHWFTRQADGATRVDSADLDGNGAFGDWPEDFGAVELETESRYLDAVSERGG